jgi:ribonucleoside-triphosphate reductase
MQSMLSPLVSTRLHKRDGTLVPFDAEKIRQALIAAGTATGEYRRLTSTCYWCGAGRSGGIERLDVEQIQDSVERVLMDAGYFLSMRAYIVYREQHGRREPQDPGGSRHVDERIPRPRRLARQANANQGYSLGGLILNVSGKVTANYWLDESTRPDRPAHREADCTSTISTCWPATAPAGRCARCCTKASTACRARSKRGRPST